MVSAAATPFYGCSGLIAKLCLTLATPWTLAPQAPLSMGFPKQEYWSGLPFLSPSVLCGVVQKHSLMVYE